jgi:phosphoglycerate kinase
LIRIDCDVDLAKRGDKLVVDEDFRLRSILPTIHFLQEKKAGKIILLGHLGRPGGKRVEAFSLQPVADWFSQKVEKCALVALNDLPYSFASLSLIENLRFHPGEKENDPKFSEKLAFLGDVYINDAFGVSHREHASIVGIPKLLPSFLGLRMEGEMKTLLWLKSQVPRPLVFVLGGSKPGKLDYLKFLADWADWLLVGGKLPILIKNEIRQLAEKIKNYSGLMIGKLKNDGKDLDEKTIEEFGRIIKNGKSVIWAGPMGVYEEEESRRGTWAIAKAVANSNALRIAGGGDTHRILSWLKLWDRFDFVSVGGGAMLQFLKDDTLPGIEAIKKQSK